MAGFNFFGSGGGSFFGDWLLVQVEAKLSDRLSTRVSRYELEMASKKALTRVCARGGRLAERVKMCDAVGGVALAVVASCDAMRYGSERCAAVKQAEKKLFSAG